MNFKKFKQSINEYSIIGGFFFGFLRHLVWLLKSPEYRTLSMLTARYSHFPRFQKMSVKLLGKDFQVPDIASFLSTYQELFVNKIYEFKSDSDNPVILDFGANIGLSILYFKSLYPSSTIIAYEADPKIFQLLKENVGRLPGVTLYNKAVWNETTILSFSPDGADGGRISNGKGLIEVEAVNITDVLNDTQADFIKMDIEGAEIDVIPSCKGRLGSTKHFFCEYHSMVNESQRLDLILSTFRDEGFRIHIQTISPSHKPFMNRNIESGFDMQLNIFGWKD
mgnify:CR=1 FL=1